MSLPNNDDLEILDELYCKKIKSTDLFFIVPVFTLLYYFFR